MANVMFFDPAISGHHPEYIAHLVKYIIQQQKSVNYYFVVNPDFKKTFPEIINITAKSETIGFIEITQLEYDIIFSAGGMVKRSVNEFKVMDAYAKKLNIDHCVSLYANGLQLALGLYTIKYKIYGILFGQYTWQVFPDTFKGRLYKKRKEVQTWFMLRNKQLKAIFLLNDTKSCADLNHKFKTAIFKYLPDPVADFEADPMFDLRTQYHIPANDKVYLHVGSLEPRKGTLEIIDALKYLDEDMRSNIHIIVMGKASPVFDKLIREKIEEISNSFKVNVVYENAYLSAERLKSAFEQTDFILMPYKNTEASSGILGHAIINRKQVIGPRGGLLGYLINEYKLGYLMDSVDSKAVAKSIIETFSRQTVTYQHQDIRAAYLQTHTSNSFAEAILSQLSL